MRVDRRMQLSLISDDVGKNKTKDSSIVKLRDGNSLINQPEQFHDLNEEHLSYALLIACSNHDLLMLRYLWENFGELFWDLSNFKVLMKQLIS